MSLTDDFDDISEAVLHLLHDDLTTYAQLAAQILRFGDVQTSLREKLEEKRFLESELEKAEKQHVIRICQLDKARLEVRKERMQNKLLRRRNEQMREELHGLLNRLPMNYKKETLARLEKYAEQSLGSISSNSHIEVDATTDSSSSIGTIGGASSLASSGQSADSSDMELAFSKRISSSTESDASTIVLFSSMLEALKKRQHTFEDRCFIMGNKCFVCQKKVACGRMELRCDDCRACVHGRCHDRLALPCIPLSRLNLRKMSSTTVADFCLPGFRPQIPAFVIHSVLVVERNGFNQVGLYVLPDYSRELETLKQQVETEDNVPNFAKLRTSVVCELLKHFLSASVKTALIGEQLYEGLQRLHITKKNTHEDIPKLYDVMLRASEAERATLCFLLLHLRKVCESPDCKVSVSSMAKTFAPILLRNFKRNDPYNEKKKKISVIQNLINVPETYFEHILKDLF